MTASGPRQRHDRDDSDDDHRASDDTTRSTTTLERTPLPKLQLFITFLIQFAEPVTATVIYPFINEFVRETGITKGDVTKTGYYAGIIESVFFLSETATVLLWGMASDRYGRRSVLLLGPLGLSIAMLGFGWSKTFWPLVIWRCMQGLFNGNIGVSKSVLSEITDKTNIGDAFALIPLMWNSGVTVGPMLGGILTRPAERWRDTWGKFEILREYPYFLPCLAASFIAFLSFAISAIALKETLPSAQANPISKRIWRSLKFWKTGDDETTKPLLATASQAEYGAVISYSSSETSSTASADKPPFSKLFTPEMVAVFVNHGSLSFMDMANSALMPLVYSTPIEYGGLGLDPYQIGIALACYSLASGTLQAVFLGSAIRKYSARRVFRFSFPMLALSFCCFPIENALARRAGEADWRVAFVIVFQFFTNFFISPCYAATGVMLAHSVPDSRLLGAANGVAQTVSSGVRGFAPFIASSLFAFSVARDIAGGCLVYIILASLVLVAMQASRYLPKQSP